MRRMFVSGAAIVALGLSLVACSKGSDTSSDASAPPDTTVASAAPDAVSPEAGAFSASPETSAVPASSGNASGEPASAAASGDVSPAAVSLTDIAGVNGEKEIGELAQLGVVDPTSGAFSPGQPVKRRDFIRWLVKSNNAIWSATPAKRIQLADKTETAVFSDIPATDPDFPYVQGMQDAGYSVGFPDKTFKPDQSLTREQMFAIKNVFDRGNVDPGLAKGIDFARHTVLPAWKDREEISKTYVAAIATGAGGGATNFEMVYGSSQLFKPQESVTRAQAAVAVSAVGDHTFYSSSGERTAAQALASPAP